MNKNKKQKINGYGYLMTPGLSIDTCVKLSMWHPSEEFHQ